MEKRRHLVSNSEPRDQPEGEMFSRLKQKTIEEKDQASATAKKARVSPARWDEV